MLPDDQVRTITAMLLIVPLGFFYFLLFVRNRRLPRSLAHVYSIAVTLGLLWYTLGQYAFVYSAGSATVTYLLLAFLPASIAHKAVFVWMMVFMSVSHAYRMWTDWGGWTLDFTGSQMILTIKLTAFAMNYRDGRLSEEEKKTKLNRYQREHAIDDGFLPSPLEYFGYVYFFPSFLAGPAIEFMDYRRFVHSPTAATSKLFSVRSMFLALARKLGWLLLMAPLVLLHVMKFPPSDLVSESFLENPWYSRAFYLWWYMLLLRFKYYFAWSLAELGFVSSSYSYALRPSSTSTTTTATKTTTTTGAMVEDWDRATNVFPASIEYPFDVKDVSRDWNVYTGVWLKQHVFFRMATPGKPPSLFVTMTTYLVSAAWHGFYSGYLLCFSLLALVSTANRFIPTPSRSPSSLAQYAYQVTHNLVLIWVISYAGSIFNLLSLDNCWIIIKSQFALGHIIPIAFVLLGPSIHAALKKKK